MSYPRSTVIPQSGEQWLSHEGKWSTRKSLLFVLSASVVCWSLLIGKVALFL